MITSIIFYLVVTLIIFLILVSREPELVKKDLLALASICAIGPTMLVLVLYEVIKLL